MISQSEKTKKNLYAQEPEYASSNQETTPLTYIRGRGRTALTWITDVMREKSIKVKQAGKGKGGQQSSYEYFADITGAIGYGRLTRIFAIIIDKNIVLEEAEGIVVPADTPLKISIPEYCDEVYIHSGKVDQEYDNNVLNADNSSINLPLNESRSPIAASLYTNFLSTFSTLEIPDLMHPAYPGVAYISFRELYLGKDMASVPNVEVIGEFVPNTNPWGIDSDLHPCGINPILVLSEMLTDWFQFDESLIDVDTFKSVASDLAKNKDKYYISPYVTKIMDREDLLESVTKYFDGFLRWNHKGKLQLLRYKHDGSIPNVKELSIVDFIDEPKITEVGVEESICEVTIKYRDPERRYKEAEEVAFSESAHQKMGEIRSKSVDLGYYVSRAQAKSWGERAISVASHPLATGTCSVHEASAYNLDGSQIMPGDLVQIDNIYFEMDLIVRITGRSERPGSGEVRLDWEQERGLFAGAYTSPLPTQFSSDGGLQPIEHGIMYEVPPLLTGFGRLAAAPVCVRPMSASGMLINYESEDSVDFIKNGHSWGVMCTLNEYVERAAEWLAPKAASAKYEPYIERVLDVLVDSKNTDLYDIDSQSEANRLDNRLLLMCGREIFSIGEVELLDNNKLRLHTLRARGGSVQEEHLSGTTCYIIDKQDLLSGAVMHGAFANPKSFVEDESGIKTSQHQFLIQSTNRTQVIDMSEALRLSLNFQVPAPALPVIEIDPSTPTTARTGTPIYVRGRITDINEDIIEWAVNDIDPAGNIRENGAMVEPTGLVNFSVPIVFMSDGTYTIQVKARDMTMGDLGYSQVDFTIAVEGRSMYPEDFERNFSDIFDEASREAWERAEAEIEHIKIIYDERIKTLDEWVDKILLDQNNMGTKFEEIRLTMNSRFEAQEGVLTRIGAVADQAKAGLEQEILTRANADSALAQQTNVLSTRLSNVESNVNASAGIVQQMQSKVSQFEGGMDALSRSFTALQARIDDPVTGLGALAGSLDSMRASVTRLENPNDPNNPILIAMAQRVAEVMAEVNGVKARVVRMEDVFVDPATGKVRAFATLKVDADGTAASMEMYADGVVKESGIRFSADHFYITVSGRQYKLTEGMPVLQQINNGHPTSQGGDSTWAIRNVFTPQWVPQTGNWKGGQAEVKVYPSNEIPNIFPNI